ncbi:hypothetical protein HOP50_06g41350 [Chloropicon primus]|uniref:Uncharacterized protein n=1 Tax=Chloropicon primus TaxID=1764295 RepID=A0A5B8MLS7_9CHLO|nr:hypothetical protein A3770_06p41260 [Chloropicon primus]UPR00819.1 hypothetical protein HOP50_06g41350 [Chloropicon primus]|mmetsp:Transcript_14230/g.40388  ORF Transcript_14230/g.40388 Transcript_14230/m.40388 type:complete len:217 (-) Transcript_14230:2647-3297(-)|eukprot:QDZ21608.1 hypothetical protein A3770_06p41260 [Chloropicon primus]
MGVVGGPCVRGGATTRAVPPTSRRWGKVPSCRSLDRVSLTRRTLLGGLLGTVGTEFGATTPPPAARAEEATIPAWDLDGLAPSDGWRSSGPSGDFKYRVLRRGEGDSAAGIFDPPEAFKTFPFVAVTFAVYNEQGQRIHGTDELGKAEWAYQVGIRQALEDEVGGVNQMIVGERRQFAFGPDTVIENVGGGKLFGKKVGAQTPLLVDVTLLSLRPY